jgi:hypothetical protein
MILEILNRGDTELRMGEWENGGVGAGEERQVPTRPFPHSPTPLSVVKYFLSKWR